MKKIVLILMAMLFTASVAFGSYVEIGTGTGYSTVYGPFCNYYENNKTQTLYLQSELGSAKTISQISFNIDQVATSQQALVNFTINFLHTDDIAFISGSYHDMTGATQVFSSNPYTVATSTGWTDIDITDFAYNGTQNLIVEIIWGDQGGTAYTYYRNYKTSSSGTCRMLYGYADGETPPLYNGSAEYFSNMRFHYLTPHDFSTLSHATDSRSMPDTTVTTGSSVTFHIVAQNLGTTTETSPIKWTCTGGSPTSDTDENTGSLAQDATESYTFSPTWTAPATAGTYTVKFYTDLSTDTDHSNDTTAVVITVYEPYTLPFTENFTSTTEFPAGWESWQSSAWTGREWTPAGGGVDADGCAYSGYYGSIWLISKKITAPAGGDLRFNFYQRNISETYYYKHGLYYSTTGAHSEGDWTAINADIEVAPTWWAISDDYSIPDYSGNTLYIAFKYSGRNKDAWYVDDVHMMQKFEKDIAVNSATITDPSGSLLYCVGVADTISAVIENKGSESDPTTVRLVYKEGSEPANNTDGTFQDFAPTWTAHKDTCTFSTNWLPSAEGNRTVYVKAFYTGDENSTNDVASKTVNVKAQYTLLYESFETWDSSTPYGPPNWSESDIAAGTTVGNSDWNISSSAHQEGSYSAHLYFSQSSNSDDWLISPAIDLTANTSKGASQLSYWIRFGPTLTAGDYLYVKISTDGGATWSATLKTYDDSNTSGMTSLTWQGIDLAAYSGESNVKIGFYGDNNRNSACYIYMDVVKIAPETAPAAATNPDPTDTDTDIDITTNLTWSDGVGAISYDVYLGTNNPPTNIVNGTNQAGTTYDPASDLAYNTLHYWRIDAVNGTGTTAGDVWSFTTENNDPNYGGGGAGTGGYYFANSTSGASGAPSQPSYNWIDISGTGTEIPTLCANDEYWALDLNTLGFSFTHFGTTWGDAAGENLYICSNGWMRFDNSNSSDAYFNSDLPTDTFENGIMPFWDDLDPSDAEGGNVYYKLMGDGTLVVEYYLVPRNGGTAETSNTFEVIFYPSNGNIKFQYFNGGMLSDLTSSTVGIQGGDGDPGTDPNYGYVTYLYDGTGGPLQGSGLAVMFGTDDGTLPVVLTEFTAEYAVNEYGNEYVVLNWTTASETDVNGFNVYRNNENDFGSAAKVNVELIPGSGTSTETHNYTYNDESIMEEELHTGDTYYYWLEIVNFGGTSSYTDAFEFVVPDNYEPPVPPELPLEIGLYQNCPNPFNPDLANTKICFYLGEGTNANVEIKVYNIKGELVKTIWNQYTVFEDHPVPAIWNGCDENGKVQANGIYFYRMTVNGKDKEIKKLILVR